jgi:copper chaperone
MQTTTYSVPGMSCSHCRVAIDREVTTVAGVSRVDVDFQTKRVTVTGAFSDQQVRNAIDDAGYDIA